MALGGKIMIKYMKIVKYATGDSIAKQIQNIIDNGMMDADTRLFFDKSNCVTMNDIKSLITYFDINSNSIKTKPYQTVGAAPS